ncbi:MAG: hypothetical protein IKB34_05460 [Clostridia bacterium]|nr:hypothetical protein [Clostridia bacterium]
MKKNVFLKLASALLVLCLASTCAIGTTFAKYTTADKASDTARVAKWGITVATSGSLFGTDYASNSAGTDADSIVASSTNVNSSNVWNIVAPGTKNEAGFQVKLSGTPEVAYNVTATNNDVAAEDIWLAEGTYGVMVEQTGLNAASNVVGLYTLSGSTYTKVAAGAWAAGTTYYALHDITEVDAKYFPIQWAVVHSGSAPAIATTSDLNAIAQAMIDNLNTDALDGLANEDIAASYKLTWKWAFELDAATNAKDTILGNLIAAVSTPGQTNIVKMATATTYTAVTVTSDMEAKVGDDVVANLQIAFGLKVTVDQVD